MARVSLEETGAVPYMDETILAPKRAGLGCNVHKVHMGIESIRRRLIFEDDGIPVLKE